jgi:hypothetical protein
MEVHTMSRPKAPLAMVATLGNFCTRFLLMWLLVAMSGHVLTLPTLAHNDGLAHNDQLTPDDQDDDQDADQEETPVMVTGKLDIVHADDFVNKRSRFFYMLEDGKNKRVFKLRLEGPPPAHIRSGSTVTVRGKAKGHNLVVAQDAGGMQKIAAAALAAPEGEQRTLVLAVNFRDASLACSVDAIQDLMFTDPNDASIDDFYQEASFGQVWFSGDVQGPYTIDYFSTGACDYYGWAAAADALAQANGVDLSLYDRKVYVLPSKNTCGWGGLGTVGGNPSRAWILSCGMKDIYGHELGHNLTAHHAATPSSEYGDRSDIMGISGVGLRHFNAPHKEQLGWLPPSQVLTVTEDGVYEVAPLALAATDTIAPQALKIAKPDTNEYYYLSYRKALGFDASLSSTYRNRVNVHRYKGNGAVQTYFLSSLLDGTSFTDLANGLTVTQLRHDANTATVQVSFGCSPARPTVRLTPGRQGGQPGATLEYTVTVTNRDSASCPQTTFQLFPAVPAGWAGTPVPNTLTLPPGAKGSARVSITSPLGVPAKNYTVRVQAVDNAEPLHTATARATYVVDLTPPIAPTNLTTTRKPSGVSLSWGVATDNVKVRHYTVWRDGVNIGQTTRKTYRDTTAQPGMTYTYYVVAHDAAGNASVPSTTVAGTR